MKTQIDLTPLLKEPDAQIVVTRHELLKLCIEADRALDGDSNDAEHDALCALRDRLSTFLEDPERRSGLKEYRVSLHEEPGDKFTLYFDCWAEDQDHAEEQAENAYPGCEILIITAKENA
jgi:hypothetical protein